MGSEQEIKYGYELNKVYCDDCYEAIKKIPDKSIDLVYTDPPYEFCAGGKSHSELGDRANKNKIEIYSLDTEKTRESGSDVSSVNGVSSVSTNVNKKQAGTGYTSGGGCFGTKNRNYHSEIQETDVNREVLAARKKYLDYVAEHGVDEESERLRVIANAIDNKRSIHFVSKGVDNSILDELVRVMKKINIYIWCNKAQLRQYIDYFDDLGCFIDVLVWGKSNPIPTCNGTYLSDLEYLIFARESGVKVYGTYDTKHKWYLSEANVSDKEKYFHPTIKPLEFVLNHIENSSCEGDVILDPFMGSGTTGVACKRLGRNFIGFELNKKFCDIANDRINGITANGQTSIFTDFDNL